MAGEDFGVSLCVANCHFESSPNFIRHNEIMTEIPKNNYQISNKSQFNKILNSKFFVMDLF